MDKRLKELLLSGKIGWGNLYLLDTYNQAVYDDVACTITTRVNASNQHFVIEKDMEMIERDTPMKGDYTEPRICTMVGRDPNNPKSKKKADKYEQMMEIGGDVCNTLTSVQKDNLLYEPLRIPQATAQGYVEVEPGSLFDGSYPNSKTRRGRVQNNGQCSPTLTACGETPYYYEGVEEWKTIIGNKQMNPFRGDVEGVSPCITSACGAGGGMTPMLTDAELETTKTKDFIEQVRGHQPMNYRIRKLTPRECFRLMGVSESDIDKISQCGVSQSQQYKMAGNSIVVDVLEQIFRKLFVDKEQESQQLRLF